jgi:hypothetical protein
MPRYQIAICAIFQNEAPYLREWIEFHRMVGVKHFYLYDNLSDDGAVDVLAPYCRTGLVTLTPWPHSFEEFSQAQAYNDCLARFGGDCRWLALIDIDEFLFSPECDDLRKVLRDYEEFPAVVVNWQVYGSAGHVETPSGLVIENFLQRAPTDWVRNRRLKSIVDPARTTRVMNPHFAEYSEGVLAVSENREPCLVTLRNRASSHHWAYHTYRIRNRFARDLSRIWPGLPMDPYLWSSTNLRRVSVSRLRINHYAIKSAEEFGQKARRRRVPEEPWSGLRVHDDLRFRYHDRNEIRDDILLKFVPALRQLLSTGP